MRTLKLLAAVGLVLVIFGGGLLLLQVPCGRRIREAPPRGYSAANLKGIALALHTYYDVHKTLPPAVVRDKEGKPLYSWRVALLPYLEQAPLYNRFHRDEPWDSPHNKALLEPAPFCYDLMGLDDPPGTTRYQVFIGPGTAFERDGLTLKAKDFPDARDETIFAIEAGEPVLWSKPADLAYDPNGPLPQLVGGYTKPVHFLGYETGRQAGFNACFADGSVRFLFDTTDEQTLRSLITRNGGEKVDWAKVE